MTIITRAQRLAIKRVFDRGPLIVEAYQVGPEHSLTIIRMARSALSTEYPIPYRAFRKLAQPAFTNDGAIAIPWCGMWLCIEADGYTHS